MRELRRLSLAAAFCVGAAAVTFTNVSKSTARAEPGCGVETLRGAYAVYGTGIVFGASWAGVGKVTFDGAGHSTANMTESYAGVIDDGVLEGTYSLNPDCRGSLTYDTKHYVRRSGLPHEYRHDIHDFDVVVTQAGQKLYWMLVDTQAKGTPSGLPATDDPSISVSGWIEKI